MPEEAAAHKERKGEEGTEVRDSSRNEGLYWEINVRFRGCFVKIRIATINHNPF